MSSAAAPPGDLTRHDWALDILLAGVLGGLTCFPHLLFLLVGYTDNAYRHPFLSLLACVGFVAPLAIRRVNPLLMARLMGVAGLFYLAIAGSPPFVALVVPLAVYTVARWVPGDQSRQVLWIGFLGAILGPLRWAITLAGYPTQAIALFVFLALGCFGAVVTPYAMGRRLREQAEADETYRRQVAERQRLTLAAHEHRVRMAEVNARQDIARELHDIVAHSLSVMIVQAEGGRALAAKKPEAAVEVLDTIAETGREALAEARRIVGILRSDPQGHGAEFGPAPTLADLPDLVARIGGRSHLETSGPIPSVSPATALTVYRVVQEALTNVLKHAGPTAQSWVTVHYSPHLIDVEVRDDGAGAAVRSDGLGNGLRGMTERVTAMQGRMIARPHPDGGFVVRAWIPTGGGQFGRM